MSPDEVRFLLVDDLDDNLNALEALLRHEGLKLDRARSGAEALELMLANDYALALLDVQMPGMDGYELAELMRGTERTRKIPIIFITAAAFDEHRRFRGYEAGAVDYITKPIDPLILKFKAQIFFELGQKAIELARQRDEMQAVSQSLSAALARLRAHVDNSPLAVVEIDGNLVIRSWSCGAERMFGRPATEVEGRSVADLSWLESSCVAPLRDWIASADGSGAVESALSVKAHHASGAIVSCECYGSIIPPGGGAPQTVSLQILDVSERLRAEETRSLLVGELSHRVKNTLANVQAIARQTLRSSESPERFVDTFTGRIQAFSRAHSLLSDETWSGADLGQLVAEQCQLGTIPEDRIRISGAPIRLSPSLTLRMALILHELNTNAVKYGALAESRGRIDLSWTVEHETLHFRWAELGVGKTEAPQHRGFGTTLIEANAAADGGNASADWQAGGVTWTLQLPLPVEETPVRDLTTHSTKRVQESQINDRPTTAPKRLTAKRILVVEDEVMVAMEVVAELEDAGAQVVGVARSVAQALELIDHTTPEAVVLDGNLKGERVDDLALALSARSIPFCFFSGYGSEHLPRDFSHVPVVQKPFDPNNLMATLAELLSKRSSSRTRRQVLA